MKEIKKIEQKREDRNSIQKINKIRSGLIEKKINKIDKPLARLTDSEKTQIPKIRHRLFHQPYSNKKDYKEI